MNQASRNEAEDFLRRFRRALAALRPDIRDDLAEEVRSHFEERLAQEKLDLAAFGSPEEYASRFVDIEALRAAVFAGNPLRLAAALVGRVGRAAVAVFVVLPLALLEIAGLALAVIGFCKPFSSGHIGLFLEPGGGFGGVGWIANPESMREVLGNATMPVFIFGGLLLFWACYRLLLRVARHELSAKRVVR